MLTQIEIPKYLDVLLILDPFKVTKIKRLKKNIDRSSTYICGAIVYLRDHELITIVINPRNSREQIIELTPKGADVQNIIITLYNIMGLKKSMSE
jgi:DNA-binding MarR family transcriptional regulator